MIDFIKAENEMKKYVSQFDNENKNIICRGDFNRPFFKYFSLKNIFQNLKFSKFSIAFIIFYCYHDNEYIFESTKLRSKK